MKKKSKFSPTLYQFLLTGGYLERGDEGIAEGKKEYRKIWMRNYKAKYRDELTEHTVACKPQEEELLQKAANERGISSVSEYLRIAAIAYHHRIYLSPSLPEVFKVRQEFIYLRSQIERVRERKTGLFEKSRDVQIESLLTDFQGILNKAFKQPDDAEEVIRQTLKKNPAFIERLTLLIQEHVNQERRDKDA